MINEKKQLLFGFHVPSNNRYISLHIFCVLSESDATFNVGPLSIGPGLLERIMNYDNFYLSHLVSMCVLTFD